MITLGHVLLAFFFNGVSHYFCISESRFNIICGVVSDIGTFAYLEADPQH